MSLELADILVEGTVVGTPYRKLFCYDLASLNSLSGLKARVIGDLKAAGAPLDSDCEVVLRNYHLADYDHTAFNSDGAKSCALSDQDLVGSSHSRRSRLLAAAPSPRVPVGPADDSRHAMNAIASRQLYDRVCGGGSVLPLEARVKQSAAAAPSDGASADGPAASSQATGVTQPQCLAAEAQPFDITVRDFRGRSHTVRVCGGTSVRALKQGIAAALGCSVVSHWRLLHTGRPLTDDLDMADYNIIAGSVIDVQMTSQQNMMQPGTANACGSSKEAGNFSRTSNSGIGSTGLGSPGDRSPGGHMTVQVFLPCGRVLYVPRWGSEELSVFSCRVLEAERALLAPMAAGAEVGVAAGSAGEARRAHPSAALAALAASRGPLAMGPGVAPPMEMFVSGQRRGGGLATRRKTGKLNGVIGHKLLAVLLAAAAVVMALAVL